MFELSFDKHIPETTVNQLEKWGKVTRIFEESATGYGNISCAHVTEILEDTGLGLDINLIGIDPRIYRFSRSVENEWGEGYPYFDEDRVALVEESDGERSLIMFDDLDQLDIWLGWARKHWN